MVLRDLAVGFLRFVVELLLLLGTSRLCGVLTNWKRLLAAAALAGVHSWACLQRGFSFLGNPLWCTIALVIIAWIAFGWTLRGLQSSAVFGLLSLALEGLTAGVDSVRPLTVLFAACCVCIICAFGFWGRPSAGACIPVELTYGEKHIRLMALRDTGNMLKDPLTGNSVLVVDASVAQTLTGLTLQQLSDPVGSLSKGLLPGLRLIPYQALGKGTGLLLAVRLPRVRIGSWQGSALVAFAPGALGTANTYQALTGGI